MAQSIYHQSDEQTRSMLAPGIAMGAPADQNQHIVLSVFSSVAYEHHEWAVRWLAQASLDDKTRFQLQSMLDESFSYGQDHYQTQYSGERPFSVYSKDIPYIEGH